jgi:hypothetical protein
MIMSSLELASEKPLHKLLRALKEADDCIDNINWDEQDALMEAGKLKVDSYKYIHDKLTLQLEHFSDLVKRFTEAKKSAKSNLDGFMRHLQWAMETNGFEMFTGQEYLVRLRSDEYCEIKEDMECLPKHKIMYGDFVRIKYEWSKTAITKALESDDPDLRAKAEQLAQIGVRRKPEFDIIKEERSRGKNNRKPAAKKSGAGKIASSEPAPIQLDAGTGERDHRDHHVALGEYSILYAEPSPDDRSDALPGFEYVAEEPEASQL